MPRPAPTSTRSVSRPEGPRAARRRQQLIEAAYEVFIEKGYAAAGIADIAARLDIGHGTFYRYFDSKRDILDEVIDYGVERFIDAIGVDALTGGLASADEFFEQMRRLADRVFELVEAEPGLMRVIMLEAPAIDDELTVRIVGLMDTFGALAGSYLDRAADAGILRPGLDTEVLSYGVIAMLCPAFVLAFRGDFDDAARTRYQDALVGLIATGIRVR